MVFIRTLQKHFKFWYGDTLKHYTDTEYSWGLVSLLPTDTHRGALGVIAINTRATNRPCSTSKILWYYQLCFTPPSVSVLCDNGLLGNTHCYKQKVFQMEAISWLIVSKTKYGQSHSTQPVGNLRIGLIQDNV